MLKNMETRKNHCFHPSSPIRFSSRTVIFILLLLALSAHHYYGTRNYGDMVEASMGEKIIGTSINPVAKLYYCLPLNSIPRTLRTNNTFNVICGFAEKLAKCALLFFFLRTFIKNDITVFFAVLSMLVAAGYLNTPSFSLGINIPSCYDFRGIAGALVLLSLYLLFRLKWLWAGAVLGFVFIAHSKVGIVWGIMTGLTVLIWSRLNYKDNRLWAGAVIRFFGMAAGISAVFSLFSFISMFLKSNGSAFPLYTQMLKMEPDDYYFIYRFFVDRALILGLLGGGVSGVFLYHYKIKKYVVDENRTLSSNPLTIFTAVAYVVFFIAIVLEYFIYLFPNAVAFSLLGLRLWSGMFLVGFALAILGAIVFSITLYKAESICRLKLNPGGVARTLVIACTVVSLLTLFIHDKGDKNNTYGPAMYTQIIGKNAFDAFGFFKNETETIYSEDAPIILGITKTEIRKYENKFREINWMLVNGNMSGALVCFNSVTKELSSGMPQYFDLLRANCSANMESYKGNVWEAYRGYQRIGFLSRAVYVGIDDQALNDIAPRSIPLSAYKKAITWIKKNIPGEARFINAPHIDNFTVFTLRDAFFMQAKHEGHISCASAGYARVYLERLHDVLGLTTFDMIGPVFSSLDVPMVRYAFLGLKKEDFERIGKKHPGYSYIFTEAVHVLPFPVVYRNAYFVVYKMDL